MLSLSALISLAASPIARIALAAVLAGGGVMWSYVKGRAHGYEACERKHAENARRIAAELDVERRDWDNAQRVDEDSAIKIEKHNDATPVPSASGDGCLGERFLRYLNTVK